MPVKLLKSTKVSEHFSTTHWNCFQIEYRHEGKSLLVTLRTLMKTLVAAYKEKDGGLHSELLATNKSHLTPQLPPLHKIQLLPWKEGTFQQVGSLCDEEVARIGKFFALEEVD